MLQVLLLLIELLPSAVYGRENRLKVSRDEAAHTEIEKVVAAKQKQVKLRDKRLLSGSNSLAFMFALAIARRQYA